MTTAEHLVVLTVMAAEGQEVTRHRLEHEHGEEAVRVALWKGPLHEGWRFPEGRTPYVAIYYAGPRACRP